jgi:DNA polymerase III alpha subunit
MGFYAPAQLVNDARRHEVAFRLIDVQHSEWDCTLEANAVGEPEIRLGLRMVAGLAEDQGRGSHSITVSGDAVRPVDVESARFFPGSIKSLQIVQFLKALRSTFDKKLLIVWESLQAHRSRLVKNTSTA